MDHSLERLISSGPMQPISVTYACVECAYILALANSTTV